MLFAPTQMVLEGMRLSETSQAQTQKDKEHTIVYVELEQVDFIEIESIRVMTKTWKGHREGR